MAGTALWVFTMQPHVGGTADDVGGILPIALTNFEKGIFYIGRTGLTAGSSYGVPKLSVQPFKKRGWIPSSPSAAGVGVG